MKFKKNDILLYKSFKEDFICIGKVGGFNSAGYTKLKWMRLIKYDTDEAWGIGMWFEPTDLYLRAVKIGKNKLTKLQEVLYG